MARRPWILPALLGFLLGPATASAQIREPVLAADASHTGYVNLVVFGEEGTEVEFFERVGDRRVALGRDTMEPFGAAYVLAATTWRCDRLLRRFESRTVEPSGRKRRQRFSLRTPSCRNRLGVEAPLQAEPGTPVTVTVTDDWGIGSVSGKLCLVRGRERARCERFRLARGAGSLAREVSFPERGVWRVQVRLRRHRDAVGVGVGVPAPPRVEHPVVLATGDSTIQGIESFLSDRLPDLARVRREYLVGSGISRAVSDVFPYWPNIAQRQAFEREPRLTVISIGAIDGHPMDVPGGSTVECCGEGWIAEYARRVDEMMAAYARGGAARVLWLTLPRPRQTGRARASAAVNEAIRRAATGDANVRLVQLDRVFTPGWRFRTHMRDHGRRVRVREADGIHLTAKGTAIAARAVAAAVRAWPGTL